MTLFEFLKDFKETQPKKKLRLPKKFARQFGETLLNVAFLKPTFGFTWKIGLNKSDNGKIWFDNGWPEFVKHFGLDKGRSLFLRYHGDSEFSVSIFDNRKCISQIYRDNNPNIARPEANSVNAIGSCGNPIEISGSFSDDDGGDDEVALPQRKRMRTRADNRCKEKRPMSSPSNEDLVSLSSQSQDINTLIAFGKLCDKKARRVPRSPKLNSKDKARNPSFMLSMEPFFETTIRKTLRRYLCVPYSFGSVYLEQKKHIVMLELGKRLWPVTFSVCQRRNYLSEGYFEFVQNNSLKHGDICKYEPKLGNKTILKVTIYRS